MTAVQPSAGPDVFVIRADLSEFEADLSLIARGLAAFDAGALQLSLSEERLARAFLDCCCPEHLDKILGRLEVKIELGAASGATALTGVARLQGFWRDVCAAFRAVEPAIEDFHSRSPVVGEGGSALNPSNEDRDPICASRASGRGSSPETGTPAATPSDDAGSPSDGSESPAVPPDRPGSHLSLRSAAELLPATRAHIERPRLARRVDGGIDLIDADRPHFTYQIDDASLSTPTAALRLLQHLGAKRWVTRQHLLDLVDLLLAPSRPQPSGDPMPGT